MFDKGYTTYNSNFKIILQNHVRILIVNETEFNRATIKIPFHKDGSVTKLKAASYNLENGVVTESELSRKDIFDENVVDDRMVKRFTIPNVKKGSIIEYTYIVTSENYRNLNTWYFQTSIPVLYSEYSVSMPSFFNYSQNLSGYLPITDFKVDSEPGRLSSYQFNNIIKTFISVNIPAFVEEDFITHASNYISKVQFNLIDYTWPNSMTEVVNPSTFEELSLKLAKFSFFQSIYNNNNFLNEDVMMTLFELEEADSETKARAIFKFVKNNYTLDRSINNENIRQVYKEKKGSSLDINSLLSAMLINVGLKSYPVLISKKSNGKLNRYYPARSDFNTAICLVQLDGKDYFVDASNSFLPFNTLSPESINDQGLIVSEERLGLIDFGFQTTYSEKVIASLEILDNGSIKGTLDAKEAGYAALQIKERFDNNFDKYKESFETAHRSWLIDKHEVEAADDEEIVEHLAFTIEPSVMSFDNLIVFNPILVNRISKNPFDLDKRNLPVTLKHPTDMLVSFKYQIPADHKVKELPKAVNYSLPNNAGRFSYSSQKVGDFISVTSIFKLEHTEFTSEEYFMLKEFYALIIEKHKEEIVLEKI